MAKEIRIFIADDHPIFREGLKKVIELHGFNALVKFAIAHKSELS